ncbi:MAG: PhnE/PtxC family ABC transporter permease [Ruthenibacterium lactatiformans]
MYACWNLWAPPDAPLGEDPLWHPASADANFASAIYRFDINLRDATVLGLVGAGGIGAPLIFAMNSYRWSEAGAILAGLIVLVLAVEWLSTKIRIKLARG